MSEVRLFIARHGETDYNRKGLLQGRGIDASLNDTGKAQALALSEYLENYPADVLGSSTLKRAEETALYYGKVRALGLKRYAGLDEMDFGEFEGVPYQDAAEELKKISSAWKKGETGLKLPGGESPDEVFKRANESVMNLVETNGDKTLVLVVHGRLIRIILSEWLGLGLNNMDQIAHHNGGVNQLIFKNGRFEAVYLNKTDHLNNIMQDIEYE